MNGGGVLAEHALFVLVGELFPPDGCTCRVHCGA